MNRLCPDCQIELDASTACTQCGRAETLPAIQTGRPSFIKQLLPPAIVGIGGMAAYLLNSSTWLFVGAVAAAVLSLSNRRSS